MQLITSHDKKDCDGKTNALADQLGRRTWPRHNSKLIDVSSLQCLTVSNVRSLVLNVQCSLYDLKQSVVSQFTSVQSPTTIIHSLGYSLECHSSHYSL